MHTEVETVIIGSGICGLSIAHFMSKQKKDFVLLESEPQIGGIIQTNISDKFICEYGPNTVLLNNDAIKELIKDLGMWEMLIYPEDYSNQNRYVLINNELEKIPLRFFAFLRSAILSKKAKFRIFFELFVKKHSKNTTVYDFVCKRFGKEFHDKLIEPFITGVYAGDTKNMSTKHSLKLLWNLEQTHGSVLKGLFKSKSAKKEKVHSFNFPSGLGQLVSAISNNLEEQIKLEKKVIEIVKKPNGFLIKTEKETFFCKKVVSTVPSYVLKELVFDDSFSKEMAKVTYNPIDVFHFGFYKKNIKKMKKGFGVLTKPSDNKSFLGVLFNSQIFKHVSSSDTELFTILVGGERQKELCQLESEKLEGIILKEVEDLIDHQGEVLLKEHYRWKKGIPQYDMNQEDLIQKIDSFEKENPGFYVLGNYFNGVSVSDAVLKGKNLSEKL